MHWRKLITDLCFNLGMHIMFGIQSCGRRSRGTNQLGFTFPELLVVMAVIAMLAGVVLPAAGKFQSRSKTHRILCMSNGKQLVLATQLYAGDNNDFLMPNPDDGNTVPGHNWCPGIVSYLPGATNINYLVDARYNMLASYIGLNYAIFKCPAEDKDLQIKGETYQRVRSVAMNHAVGTICSGFASGGGHSGVPAITVHGPWLDGNHGHRSGAPFRTFGKQSDFLRPALTWIFIDEDGDSINDGNFVMSVAQPKWIDWPSTCHDMAAGVAFADGRAEIHPWIVPTTRVRNGNVNQTSVAGDPRDWKWLAERTSYRQVW